MIPYTFLLKDKHRLYQTTYFKVYEWECMSYYISIQFTGNFSPKILTNKTESCYLHEF